MPSFFSGVFPLAHPNFLNALVRGRMKILRVWEPTNFWPRFGRQNLSFFRVLSQNHHRVAPNCGHS